MMGLTLLLHTGFHPPCTNSGARAEGHQQWCMMGTSARVQEAMLTDGWQMLDDFIMERSKASSKQTTEEEEEEQCGGRVSYSDSEMQP